MAGSSFMGKILESVASTNFGQFVIKTLDLLLWTIEKPAKYCVNGGSNTDTRKLAWPVFWTVLINLQIFRLVFSTILQQFNGNRLETKDIVRCVQKWRRSLRSIRFRGLRKIREEQSKNANGNSVICSPPPKMSSKKRNHDEMEAELFEDLLNRTFCETDDTDSTFMISKYGEPSTSGSSNGQSLSEDYQSPSKSKNDASSSLQDTLPTVSASESDAFESNMSLKSNEVTFVSTVDDTEESAHPNTEEDSANSLNGEGHTESESGNKPIGKAALNQPSDPVDVMMSKLVELEKNGKSNFKKSGKNHRKKRNHSFTTSDENLNRQSSLKNSRSQEAIDKF